MPRSSAQLDRLKRQENLREWLANQGLVAQAVELIERIDSAGDKFELDKLDAKLKHMTKLINKYLPDTKEVNATVDTNVSGELRTLNILPVSKSEDG